METASGVERMRLVGGNLAIDFVNSCSGPPHGPPDDDALADYDEVVAWAAYAGGLAGVEAERLRHQAQTDHRQARTAFGRTTRTRAYLDELFRALANGGTPDSRLLAQLRDDEVDALRHARLDVKTGWTWADDTSLLRPLHPVVHAAVELVTDGPLHRLKGCAGCRFLFLDESKNRSRRWCAMEDCGTNEKMRRYITRRANRRGMAR